MKGFEFSCPTKIVCGKGSLDKVTGELRNARVSRPLIITDKGLVKLGLVGKLLKILDAESISYELFDAVPPDSSLSVIDEVSTLYAQCECDGFIAFGGGSVIDTTKGAAVSSSCKGIDFSTLQGSGVLTESLDPFVAIPTTAGTGSEVTLVAVVADTEKQVKLSFTSYKLIPHVAILDPALTVSLPPKLTSTTGMDALTHAIEAYTSLQKNPVSDAFAICSLKLIKDNIFKACAHGDDVDARTSLALGSLMAGASFSNAMVGIIHAIGHSLGGLCQIPHGQAMMLLLPHCVDYNIAQGFHTALYRELLCFLDEDRYMETPVRERDAAFATTLHDMNRRFSAEYDTPIKLRDLGVEPGQFEAIARQARYDGAALYNVHEITEEAVVTVLESAY